MSAEHDEYRKNKMEKALVYQDFAVEVLWHGLCLPVCVYGSRAYQYGKGESVGGVEIKLDERMSETGNLFIETHEKSSPEVPQYSRSGIYKAGWLYVIGDFETVFVFSTKFLKCLIDQAEKDYRYDFMECKERRQGECSCRSETQTNTAFKH